MNGFDFFQQLAEFQAKRRDVSSKIKVFFLDVFRAPFSQRGLIILFVVAFGFGASIKSQVNDVVTIGYDDYKVKGAINAVDLNKIQADMIQNGKPLSLAQGSLSQGETCSE